MFLKLPNLHSEKLVSRARGKHECADLGVSRKSTSIGDSPCPAGPRSASMGVSVIPSVKDLAFTGISARIFFILSPSHLRIRETGITAFHDTLGGEVPLSGLRVGATH